MDLIQALALVLFILSIPFNYVNVRLHFTGSGQIKTLEVRENWNSDFYLLILI